jgi:curli biogenesis system outer membrane secretion channel CsgG
MRGPASLPDRRARLAGLLLLSTALAGCIRVSGERLAPGEQPVLTGPAVRDNRTPMDPAFACFRAQLAASGARAAVIAVGDVRDFTGKYSVNEGTAVTQGGPLMVTSALGKLLGPITIAERFDPTIAERELGYVDRRQLGDGQRHAVAGSPSPVAWLPYYGGTIAASDYYIVGGITELNYNIRSGGAELRVGQIGPKARSFTQSVAVDLRIVDTRSLLVVQSISLTKQLTGYEVGFNTFRFFGSSLFDINVGAKALEPLQLGIRTTLEEATIRLVAAVTRQDVQPCLDGEAGPVSEGADIQWAAARAAARAAAQAGGSALLNSSGPVGSGAILVAFAHEGDVPDAPAAMLARVAAARKAGPVELTLTARDSEAGGPARRAALTDRRIAAVAALLAEAGIPASALTLRWRPSPQDNEVHRDAAGFQRVAQLRVER